RPAAMTPASAKNQTLAPNAHAQAPLGSSKACRFRSIRTAASSKPTARTTTLSASTIQSCTPAPSGLLSAARRSTARPQAPSSRGLERGLPLGVRRDLDAVAHGALFAAVERQEARNPVFAHDDEGARLDDDRPPRSAARAACVAGSARLAARLRDGRAEPDP